jgi:hypothetical protein
VVIDIETDERAMTRALRERLNAVAGTIRTRVLY